MSVSRNWLTRILRKGESSKVDFKKELPLSNHQQKVEFTKDISAIANTPGGKGYFIVGVNDNRELIGIDPRDLKETRLQQIVAQHCDPPVKFSVHTLDFNSKTVVVIEIPRSLIRPHQIKDTGAFHVRRGTTTDIASTSEIVRMVLQKIEIERRQGEYDLYGVGDRSKIMKQDTLQAISQMGFKRGWVTLKERTHMGGQIRRVVAYADASVDGIPIRMYFNFFSGNLLGFELTGTCDFLQNGWKDKLRRSRIDERKAHIFVFMMGGTVSKRLIENHHLHTYTVISLEPSIVYAGLGLGSIDFHKNALYFTKYLPKFFVQRVKSADDVEVRLGIIMDWLRDNVDILKSLIKFQKGERNVNL